MSYPWVPTTPAIHEAVVPLADEVDTLATPVNQAEKWLPKPNEVEFTVFVSGEAAVSAGTEPFELDPLAFEADVVGEATATGDMAVSAIQAISSAQIKSAILLDAAEDRISATHTKIAAEQEPNRQESSAQLKSAVLFDPAEDRVSAQHIKNAITNEYPLKTFQTHAKMAITSSEGGKGSNAQSHLKVAKISEYPEIRTSSEHVKIASMSLASELRSSSEHVKLAVNNQPAEIQNSAEHIKTLISTKAAPQVSSLHYKSALLIDGMPVSISAGGLIVAQSGVGGRRNAQEHVKASITSEPVEVVSSGHTKAAIETSTSERISAAHTKVLAVIPSSEMTAAAHLKVAAPYVARRKAGWGIIL